MTKDNYRVCTRCVMDTTVPEITFDDQGRCNHCTTALQRLKDETGAKRSVELNSLLGDIKRSGTKEYDCVVGVSGGVDSTYLCYLVKQMGLRPLAVHFDNGWNSELAVDNINKCLTKLEIDLETYVVDWEEFRDIQNSFFRASVPNAEIPTDHAFMALLFNVAAKNGLKYVVTGGNVTTESILPRTWMYDSRDYRHLKAVHKRFGSKPITTMPNCSLWRYFDYIVLRKIKYVTLLNLVDYSKEEAKEFLKKEFDWRDYGGKHYENVFTRFFQAYYLPKKFNIDKRIAHLSSLICSGQITREMALEELKKPVYPEAQFKIDYPYFLKKMGYTAQEFEEIMAAPPKSHLSYPNDAWLFRSKWAIDWIKKIALGRAKYINLHLYPSSMRYQSRIKRCAAVIRDLNLFGRVELVGLDRTGDADGDAEKSGVWIKHLPVRTEGFSGPFKLFAFIEWYFKVLFKYAAAGVACVDAHTLSVLPLSVALKCICRSRLVYQPHELETESSGIHSRFRKVISKIIERAFIRFSDKVVVVNQSISDWYGREYPVIKDRLSVVRNIPESTATVSGRKSLRDSLGIPRDHMVFMYQGGLCQGRGIPALLEVFKHTDVRKHIVFMGYGEFEKEISDANGKFKNIHFHPAVPTELVDSVTAEADVGVCIIDNICLSYYLSLPNKLISYALAGVPCIASDFPEIASFVNQANSGWLINPEIPDLTKVVQDITFDEIASVRKKITVPKELTWERESEKLAEVYRGLSLR